MQKRRVIVSDEECRKKIRSGINNTANIVVKTLGSMGRNVMFDQEWRPPRITNDGVTICNQIGWDDEIENMAAKALIHAAQMTNDQAGDGTTTCISIAQRLINKCFDLIGDALVSTVDVMELKREIKYSCDSVLRSLKEMAKKIKSKEDLKKIATVSVEDEKLGETIANMFHKVGKDGIVLVEEGFGTEIQSRITEGMRTYGKYISPWLSTNERKEAVYEDVSVLVTNHNIQSPEQLKPILGKLNTAGVARFVIFAPKYSPDLINAIVKMTRESPFKVLGIKIPAHTDNEIEDIAIYTGAKFINKEQKMTLQNVMPNELGHADKIVANDDETIITGGADKEKIKERIKVLKEQQKLENADIIKKKYDIRISGLSGTIGIISVAAKTEVEAIYLKDKVDDAVHATRASLEEGVVRGGGLALQEINDNLMDNSILKNVISAPYEQIQENAGGNFEINENILDPVKVTRVALENACSIAQILITTHTAIADRRRDADSVLELVRDTLKNNTEQ